jgi:NCS1 family nucleobase:cation symporter-1
MADSKNIDYSEKDGSPTASAVDADHGQVSSFKRRFHFSLEVEQEASSFAASKNFSNADFDPIPPSKRTWNWLAYVAYWMADAWAVSNWAVGMLSVRSDLWRVILMLNVQPLL